ncbi:MAG TPA: hypothetical protein VFA30_10290 [Gaiellaceae bacterium]|nr:hypothetical protein [Gaiellaceae bacterium]
MPKRAFAAFVPAFAAIAVFGVWGMLDAHSTVDLVVIALAYGAGMIGLIAIVVAFDVAQSTDDRLKSIEEQVRRIADTVAWRERKG